MTRTINSPGIELNEIDRSQYNNKPDYSLPNAPACLICGFADKGEDYTTQWINTRQTLKDTFGEPSTEFERYFYNAGVEVLSKGGVLLMSKLPYDNPSKDSYSYCDYSLDTTISYLSAQGNEEYNRDLSAVDPTIKSYVKITADTTSGRGLLGINALDALKVNAHTLQPNKIRIVDISRQKYGKIDIYDDDQVTLESCECLGVMPIITTPMNAMMYQGLISAIEGVDGELSSEVTTNLSCY